MKKYLFIILSFYTVLFSNPIDISTNEKISVFKYIEISNEITDIQDAINNPQKFKEFKYFRKYLLKKRVDKSSWYKLRLENNSLQNLERKIYTKWEHVEVDLYLVNNKKQIYKETLHNKKQFLISNLFSINSKEGVDIYINVKLNKSLDNFYYLYIVSKNKLFDLIFEKEVFHNGIFLGILITMMMYNFFMYLSMKIKSYLYLGLYQAMLVLYASDFRCLMISYLDDYPELSHLLLRTLPLILVSIFSVLFTKEFLNTKEKMPKIDKLLSASIFIYILFQLSPIININYGSFLYATFILSGIVSYKQGNKYAIFFILGFTPTVCFRIFHNVSRLFDTNIDIVNHNYIQILAVIEAFSLSMALYLKLKQTVYEKEQAQKEAIEKEKMLLSQSKLATMGEMLASIAHQWKQPLAHLNIIFGNLLLAHQSNKLTTKYLEKKHYEADKQLKYMATTIKDFSNFFSTKNKIQRFKLKDIFDETFELTSSRVEKLQVDVKLTVIDDKEIKNYKNELIQVVIIIFNNALDAVMLNNIENRKIEVILNGNEIHICDNAGGISDEIIHKIFEPYFSTKNKKFGTGLGLYTAKIITENILNGQIRVQNEKEGAKFTLKIKGI